MELNLTVETWNIEEQTGYHPITTAYEDLSIAEHFGDSAIIDTYRRLFDQYKTSYKELTELDMALNWKMWRWYNTNEHTSVLYDELWKKVDSYASHNLKGNELAYFIKTTD